MIDETIKKPFDQDLDNTPIGWYVPRPAAQKYFKHEIKKTRWSRIVEYTKYFLTPKLDKITVYLVCRNEWPYL